jgi:hypothetical protein
VLLSLLADVEVLEGVYQTKLKRFLLVAIVGRPFFLGVTLDSLHPEGPNRDLLKLHLEGSHLHTEVETLLSLQADGSVEDISGLFFIRNDLVNLLQEDVVVVVKKVDFFPLLVIENAPADVETVEHSIIVVENFLQRKVSRPVDAQDSANGTHDYLIDLILFQQSLPSL